MGLIIHNKENNNTGRLGNKMFQAAATIGIAKHNNMEYLFNPCNYYSFFNGMIPTSDVTSLNAINYTEPSFNFSEVYFEDKEMNYNLSGYFQSSKYWKNYEDEIKKCFEPNFFIKGQVRQKYGHLLENKNTVSVHVRRGDYINLSHFHTNLTMEYYYEAMSIFRNDGTKFLIFSDDIEWCKQQDWLQKDVIFIEGNSEMVDLSLMSQCVDNIIANSSFSWWAQYLNKNGNKIVVAPSKWFGAGCNHDTKDLYLPNWIIK